MGQQQLLLLVLGIVIVGLAVVVGIQGFEENQRKARQDQTMVLLNDIAAKAQAWKKTPVALGGGANGDANDFSELTFADLGYVTTEVQGSREVVLLTEYACVKLIANTNRLDLNALNTDCGNGTWWMALRLTGSDYDDIDFRFNGNRTRNNGQ
ncbi:MAG: hypothetical protein AAGG50_03515 [Bacteroidota bacterium]